MPIGSQLLEEAFHPPADLLVSTVPVALLRLQTNLPPPPPTHVENGRRRQKAKARDAHQDGRDEIETDGGWHEADENVDAQPDQEEDPAPCPRIPHESSAALGIEPPGDLPRGFREELEDAPCRAFPGSPPIHCLTEAIRPRPP